jgi:hypothetical protein
MFRSVLALIGIALFATSALAGQIDLPHAGGNAVIVLGDGSEIRVVGFERIEFSAQSIAMDKATRRTELNGDVRIKVVRDDNTEALTIKTSKAVIVGAPSDVGH